jgi:BA14K-like protein
MEPKMISLKVLSTVAVMALVLPMVAPSVSFAAPPGKGGPGARGPSGGPRGGGAPGPRFSRGPGGGGGGAWRGRGGGGGGFIPGAVAGAVIGGAIASQGYGYGYGPGYDPGYVADPSYYDDGSGYVAVAPQGGGDDSVAYCMQTYRSYDPRSGTYMGNDGYRHPCP